MNYEVIQYTDTSFRMSRGAMRRLTLLKHDMDISIGRAFRYLASALANDSRPAFDASGDDLTQTFAVSLKPSVYAELVRLSKHLDLPVELIGELVASYVLKRDRMQSA
jgi:hypothetical protein